MFTRMLRLFNTLLNAASSVYTLLPLLAGGALVTALAAWAAWTTERLSPYAPASWVAAGLLGGLSFAFTAALVAYCRQRWVNTTLLQRFHGQADRVNPLDAMFTRQRIRIEDLASPIDRTVRGKTFIDCEILGPANVIVLVSGPGSGGFTTCVFNNCAGARFKDDAPVPNAVTFIDCNFLRCTLHRLILVVPASAYSATQAKMVGLLWLTPDPAEDAAAAAQQSSNPT